MFDSIDCLISEKSGARRNTNVFDFCRPAPGSSEVVDFVTLTSLQARGHDKRQPTPSPAKTTPADPKENEASHHYS